MLIIKNNSMRCLKLLTFFLITQTLPAQSWMPLGNTLYGTNSGDSFGRAVSFSQDGTTIAVSSPQNDINGTDCGKVAIYTLINDQWIQIGNDINGGANYNYSGNSIKLTPDGSTVIIGSSTDHTASGNWYGSAKIFKWDGTNWNQKGATLYGTSYGAYFGVSVSISQDGNTIVVGADDNPVRAFQWNATLGWLQKGNAISLSYIGSGKCVSLSADGNTFIVGNETLNNAGNVAVYSWDGSNWLQKGNTIVGVTNENVGHTLGMNADGTVIVVGSPLNDTIGTNMGEIKLYQWDGSNWIQKGQTFEGTVSNNNLVACIDSSGNTFAYWSKISSVYPYLGALNVYNWDGSQWVPKGDALDGGNGDDTAVNFVNISPDSNTVAIGFPYDYYLNDGMNHGRVKVYKWSTGLATNTFNTTPAITFFPNPTKDIIHFSQAVKTVTVYDTNGKIVSHYTTEGTELNVAALATGTYFLKVNSDKGIETFKFIKE
jgi:hypothetical protein